MNTINFSDENLYTKLECLNTNALNEFDFGVVRMDPKGTVISYNKYEADLATLSQEEVIGKNFFTQIAPCTNNFLVAAKYLEAPEKRDKIISYIFTYRIKPTQVKLRLLVEPEMENQYLLVKKAS